MRSVADSLSLMEAACLNGMRPYPRELKEMNSREQLKASGGAPEIDKSVLTLRIKSLFVEQ
jgi:hypothetical protein